MERWVKDLEKCEARPEQCGGTGYPHRSQSPCSDKSIMGKISGSGPVRTVIFECLPCISTGIAACGQLVAKTLRN